MIRAGLAHPLCAILIVLLATPSGFAQTVPAPAAVAPQATPAAPPAAQVTPAPATPAPVMPAPAIPPAGPALSITVLEGNNVLNSLPLLKSVEAVIEVRDSNDFPVEDASITFTLPAQGPGGTFVLGGKTFSTRSDARGQAIAPLIVPAGAGKFQIAVTATLGDRNGSAVVNQTNWEGAYIGPPVPKRAWYKKKLFWVVAAGVTAAVIVTILLTRGSGNSTVVITPGPPVFQ